MMKLFLLCLLLQLFFLTSCGGANNGGETNEGVTNPYGPDGNGVDTDCDALSALLPNDIITKYDLIREQSTLALEASKMLKEYVPSFIKFSPSVHKFQGQQQNPDIFEFEFSYNKKPLCSEHAKIYKMSNKIMMTGDIPNKKLLEPSAKTSSFFPSVLEAFKEILDAKKISYAGSKELCYTIKDNQLLPVWRVKFSKDQDPYEALVHNKKILNIKPLFFNQTITAKVYDEKDKKGSKAFVLRDYEIEGGSSGGTLCTERFRVVPYDEDESLAYNKDSIFSFDPDSSVEFFAQTSLFVYAQLQSDYISNLPLGKQWLGPQIEIIPDMGNQGISNGAQYLPGDNLTKPQIRMPKGDQYKLHQIRIDNEAVQHEVGHHVLYRSVQDPTGESLVIHEGIADAFVMLRTKDACLGEHLCLNDLLCVTNKCLRSADNDYSLNSPDLPFEAHLQSQLISGLFWDLAKELGHDEVANWLNYTIDYLPRRAYFSDLVVALYGTLDLLEENNDIDSYDNYCEALMSAYDKRGFMEIMEENNLECTPS